MRTSIQLFLVLVTVFGFSLKASAQDEAPKVKIEILNQDGEKVKPELVTPTPPAVPSNRQLKVETKDGKVVIRDGDGKVQELDLDGAKRIIVRQSTESTDVNGEKTTKTVGKAIVIGPDGKRQEIQIGDGVDQFNFDMPDMNLFVPQGSAVMRFEADKNKFMIGVSCEPISDAMATQLRLERGSGLLVRNVDEDSPAGKAGIELHDILLVADKTEMKSLSELVDAVQAAGKNKEPLKFTILRRGREESVEVTPTERPQGTFTFGMSPNMLPQKLGEGIDGNLNLQLRNFGPGVIFDRNEDIQKQMDEMRKRMEKEFEAMRQEMDQRMQNRFKRDN